MNLENAKVIIDSFRVIGLKDVDMKRLEEAMKTMESSFDIPTEVIETPNFEEKVDLSNSVENETLNEVKVEAPVETVLEEVPVPSNIFEQEIPVIEKTPEEVVQPINEGLNDEVQGGNQETIIVSEETLETPQSFFDRVEQESNDQVITKEVVENNNREYIEDPALIILDNLRKVIEDKNSMIKALNDKINVLENQLKASEESKKILEAQRDAAHTTLEQARQATEGPTLSYQQQNYGQAA